jgi:hypothetical protein
MKYYNWHRDTPAAPYTTCSPNLQLIRRYMADQFHMWYLGCYVRRPIRGGTKWSSHAFGAGLDLSYRADADHPDAPTREHVETVIIPWLEENHEALGIQRIHDYWARRYWQVGKGWINRPPGGRNDHIHLEVTNETWHWDTPVEDRLTSGPPAAAAAEPTFTAAQVPPYPGTSTKKGSKAKARVRQIQQRLADLGYKVGPVDGIFGNMTHQAVWNFQNDAGEYCDGIVGPKTWAALFR